MPYKDPADQAAYRRQHYLENRQRYIEMAGVRRRAERAAIRAHTDAAKARPCTDCGGSWPPYVMQFDHVRGKKLFNIGEAGRLGVSLKRVVAEIDKCEVVCGNCHAVRTHDRL